MAPSFSKNGKRLGRPPKNKPAETSGTVFTINSAPVTTPVVVDNDPPAKIEVDPTSMIECEFVPISQYGVFNDTSSERKAGRYSSSIYAIEGINWTRWVVLAYLKADFQKHREEGLKNQEILQRCVNYLNAVEPKKKYAKKDPEPKYGKLELFKEDIQFTNKFGYECAILIFTTNNRKCEHFWGNGEKFI